MNDLATAYHEVGHAVMAFVEGLPVTKVSLIDGRDFVDYCLLPTLFSMELGSSEEKYEIAQKAVRCCYLGLGLKESLTTMPKRRIVITKMLSIF